MRKRVGRIHGDGREQRLNGLRVEILNVLACFRAQLVQTQYADRFGLKCRDELVAPACVLLVHEAVDMGGQLGENSVGGAAVRARLAVAVLGLLHQTRRRTSTNSSKL